MHQQCRYQISSVRSAVVQAHEGVGFFSRLLPKPTHRVELSHGKLSYLLYLPLFNHFPIFSLQMTKLTELTGHTSRVLHMATSPDGSTVVSAAGDETLRFWRIFDTQMRPPVLKSPAGARTVHRLDIR